MAKHKKKIPQTIETPTEKQSFQFDGWKADALPLAGFYIAMAILYYPLFYLGQILTLSPDTIAAESLYRTAELVMKQSDLPLWNPYIFSGMPLFSAYQFGLFVNPLWYFSKVVSFLFGGGYSVIFLYMWLGAVGVYFVVREFGERRSLAFLCGLIWLWLPSLVVLPDVGHGSKLMSSAMLPWLLWGGLNVAKHKGWQYTGVLAILVGLSVLSLHTQITYYGFMLVGWLAIWMLVHKILEKQYTEGALIFAKLVLAGIIGVGISMVLSLPVLEFAAASSRGAATGGGVDWEYATQWSFHPKESITFLWPTYFGFGNYTYWGYMPFTDMPLTFGIVALFGAGLAIAFKRDRFTWLLLSLGIVAWIISFGNFLPILFKPLFTMLPMFNKFRVPSLILILTQLSMIVLAARGYGAVFEKSETSDETDVKKFKKIAVGGLVGIGVFFLLAMMISGGMKEAYTAKMSSQVRDAGQLQQLADQMWSLAFGGGLRSFLLLGGLAVSVWLLVKNSITKVIFLGIVFAVVAIDFLPLIHNKVRPLVGFTNRSEFDDYFAPTKRVQYLQQQKGHFRVLPMDKSRSINWWSSHGIQNATGYSGVKLGNWDALEKHEAFRNPAVWSALNIQYFTMDRPVSAPLFKEVVRDNDGYLYQLLDVMPRAYFGNRIQMVGNQKAAYDTMATPTWHPRNVTLIEGKSVSQELDTIATATVLEWKPYQIKIQTNRANSGVLVLSEIIAPHWEVVVNGKPAEALTVNGLLRGVEVPAGTSVVEWIYYEGRVFYKGLWITVFSSIVAILLIVGGIYFDRKKQVTL